MWKTKCRLTKPFSPILSPTKVLICACYVHSSGHKRKVITNDGRILWYVQIDDIAILRKVFDGGEVGQQARGKKMDEKLFPMQKVI